MDRVFVDQLEPCGTTDSWFVTYYYTQLYAALARASIHASQSGEVTLASLIVPTPRFDALHIFRVLQEFYAGECFYWEQPARQTALVGAGTALTIETSGNERFQQAGRDWKRLCDQTIVHDLTGNTANTIHGPLLFGGFCFDQQRPTTPLWQDFPDGLLLLPRFLFNQRSDSTTLTLSLLVTATYDLDGLASRLDQEIRQLLQRIASSIDLTDQAQRQTEINRQYSPRDVQPASTWKNLVAHAASEIQRGKYAKVVLAREVEVLAGTQSFALPATLQRLRQSYPGANVFALQRGERAFIGATPERLVHSHDGTLHTMALAGSAPRGVTEEDDNLLGSELLQSAKNRLEHDIVAASVRNALANLCSRVWAADTPELLRLKNIQHLQTAIVGELLPGRSLLETLAALHPTPAVGGSPTKSALAFIRENENLDRGWYAGPIGWVDLQGNGEFAVALRSALLEPERARLFAGCGIVADSVPEAEYVESCLKLQVILRSLSTEG